MIAMPAMPPAVSAKMAKIPNPLKNLPWVIEKESQREKNRLRYEASKLYRELGVAEDANYEDITQAAKNLEMRYEGDIKAQIKVGIAKDKIQQIRLSQRTAGLFIEASDAKAEEWLEKSAKASGKPVRKSEDKPDGLFNGYISIVKPNAAWRQRVLVLYGIISGIGWVFQGMAGPLSLSNWLWTAGLLSLRGRKEEGPMRMGRRRMMDKKQLVAFPLGFFIFIIGYSLGNFVTKVVPTLTGNRIEKPLQCLITCLFSGIAVAYIQIDGKNNGKDPSVNDDE
eukprot:CAMPEP_0171304306 /NCGR_PEP_ID=MMETSP0816-20121228/14037_1 /TAXON_ID=420281 /ORGANISM="Proboscia inermis, Strain CCAP1064/1" /LENGTH=280 /DNA_ID=CAMNT_0011784303 /DNA_START=206 /DNA_END=1048 /DNA_ORIENTATION=+